MISLRQHDRVGRSRAPDPASLLPSIDERAAIARRWAAATPPPGGVRREIRRTPSMRLLRSRIDGAVSAVVDPVLDMNDIDASEAAGLRAFAERMLRPG